MTDSRPHDQKCLQSTFHFTSFHQNETKKIGNNLQIFLNQKRAREEEENRIARAVLERRKQEEEMEKRAR